MANPLIYSCENYVALEPGKVEQILSSEETLIWLETWLQTLDCLPDDLNAESSTRNAAQRLLDTACDLEVKPGFKLQWFAIRLDPEDL